MKLPEALAEFQSELRLRHADGHCVEVADVVALILHDDVVGPFLRLHVVMRDGSHFDVDTIECAEMLRAATAVH